MNRLFSDKNPTSSCGRPKCFRQGRLMLTAKLICFLMIGLVGLNYNAMAQEVPVFFGSSPPVAESSGTLVLNDNLQYDDIFQWESSDSILGEIATESVTATRWNYLPGSPARLVFVGNGDGATFYGNVLFEPYNRAVVDVVKDSKRVRYLLTVLKGSISLFLDRPRWTLALTDWPKLTDCPRSPRYIFGKDRIISIEVKPVGGPLLPKKIVVEVENKDTSSTVDIVCELTEGVYRNRVPDEDLYLSKQTSETAKGDFIHVREEEVLFFRIKGVKDSEIDVMVDRGEVAAATPKDDDIPDGPDPDTLPDHRGMERGFVDAAVAFMNGAAGFDPPTTGWFDVGRKLRAPCNDRYGTFALNAGNNSAANREADILHLGGHSHVTGHLSGGDANANEVCEHFVVATTSLFRKDGTDKKEDYFKDTAKWYWGAAQADPNSRHFGTPAEWNTDIDWAMLYSCLSLDDTAFDTGEHKWVGGKYVGWDGTATGKQCAWERWKAAFTGNPRRLHGIMGYKSKGHYSNDIKKVIDKWVKLAKAGKSIPDAWLTVTATVPDRRCGAVVFIRRNYHDKIDSMFRDPCASDKVTYKACGRTAKTTKKITKKGKFKKAGKVPEEELPDPPFSDIATVYAVTFAGDPPSTLLGGQCEVWIDLPMTQGDFTRLLIERSEELTPGSMFTEDEDGVFAFDLYSDDPLVENTIGSIEAETNVRDELAQGFLVVPGNLETFGVFPGVVQTASESFENGFEVVLEQRHEGLTIFNSDVYALVAPNGVVHFAEVVFYSSQESGPALPLITATAAAEVAATDLLANHPLVPCRVSDMLAFYGFAESAGPDVLEVRPVWGVEFNLGEVIYTIDGVTGAILEVDTSNPPTLVSVSPERGTTLGGDTVTLSGTDFLPDSTVEFGGVPAVSVTFVGASTLIAETPPHAAGTVDVAVTNDNGSATLVDGFTYIE